MTTPVIPTWEPMPAKDHVVRYPLALAKVWDVESIEMGTEQSPALDPSCRFDFHDGMRMIISRNRMPDGEIVIYVSASAQMGSKLNKSVSSPSRMLGFIEIVKDRFAFISQSKDRLELLGFSAGKGVPYFLVVGEEHGR